MSERIPRVYGVRQDDWDWWIEEDEDPRPTRWAYMSVVYNRDGHAWPELWSSWQTAMWRANHMASNGPTGISPPA